MWPGRPPAWSRTLLGAAANLGRTAQQHHRVEVALDRLVVADRAPGVVQPDPPVDADHRVALTTAKGLGQQRQQGRVARGEMDHRHAGGDPLDESRE